VKTGDDLRQDQLIIMMIQLMDKLLKRAALDLCLTPYSIIATSPTSGLVEFVDGAVPISQVLSKFNGSILQFFQSVAPQNGAKFDIRPDVMSNYVRSCAGYCVITYLLGVGDRHLDNIMLTHHGHLLHIDFGTSEFPLEVELSFEQRTSAHQAIYFFSDRFHFWARSQTTSSCVPADP
jgi:phosphatidylinositol 3-kinase